jgi:hypothetical protein
LDDVVLAEHDPWWGVTGKAPTKALRERRAESLVRPGRSEASYLEEVAFGVRGRLRTAQFAGGYGPCSPAFRTNLYMVFMDATWRHQAVPEGPWGWSIQEAHFVDP